MSEKKADPPEASSPEDGHDDERDEAADTADGGEAAAASKQAAERRADDVDTPEDERDEDEAAEDHAEEREPAPTKAAPKVTAPAAVPALPKPRYAFLGIASLVFFAADAVSKWLVVTYAKEPAPRPTTDGWHFRISNVKNGNPGGAWGIFGDKPDYIRLPFFFLISAVAVVFVISLYRKLEPKQHALRWALPLLLGGALGNLIDRIRHKSVIDFLEFSITKGAEDTFKWPTFNVADVWIVAGVILMAVDMFTPRKKVPPKVVPDDEAEAPRVPRNVKRSASSEAAEEKAEA